MDQIAPIHDKALESIDDVAAAEARIAELLRKIETINIEASAACAPILKRAKRQTAPLRTAVLKHARKIDRFAKRHKRELTKNGTVKTVRIPNGGSLSWRASPPSVKIANEAAAIADIEKRGYEEFLRKIVEINREAMLERPIKAQRIEGVSIVANSKFIIQPFGVRERIERSMRSKRFDIVRPRSRE